MSSPFYYPSSFPIMPYHPFSLFPVTPAKQCHPLFFILHHSFSLPQMSPSSLYTVYPLYPLPVLLLIHHYLSPLSHAITLLYPHAPLPPISCHPVLFIACHYSLLGHVIPSSLFLVTQLFSVIPTVLFPIPTLYPIPSLLYSTLLSLL